MRVANRCLLSVVFSGSVIFSVGLIGMESVSRSSTPEHEKEYDEKDLGEVGGGAAEVIEAALEQIIYSDAEDGNQEDGDGSVSSHTETDDGSEHDEDDQEEFENVNLSHSDDEEQEKDDLTEKILQEAGELLEEEEDVAEVVATQSRFDLLKQKLSLLLPKYPGWLKCKKQVKGDDAIEMKEVGQEPSVEEEPVIAEEVAMTVASLSRTAKVRKFLSRRRCLYSGLFALTVATAVVLNCHYKPSATCEELLSYFDFSEWIKSLVEYFSPGDGWFGQFR